jgi:hypothetical protein
MYLGSMGAGYSRSGACQQKQDPDVQPVNLTICPECAMGFPNLEGWARSIDRKAFKNSVKLIMMR